MADETRERGRRSYREQMARRFPDYWKSLDKKDKDAVLDQLVKEQLDPKATTAFVEESGRFGAYKEQEQRIDFRQDIKEMRRELGQRAPGFADWLEGKEGANKEIRRTIRRSARDDESIRKFMRDVRASDPYGRFTEARSDDDGGAGLTATELLDQLKDEHPEFYQWLATQTVTVGDTTMSGLNRVGQIARNFSDQGLAGQKFLDRVTTTDLYSQYQTVGPPPPPEEETDETDLNLIEAINRKLADWGLGALLPKVKGWVIAGFSEDAIVDRIRQTDEYKQVFPEAEMRRQNGLSVGDGFEGTVIHYRQEAKRLAHEIHGKDITNSDIAQAIGHGTSLVELEHRMRVYKDVERWGPQVRDLLQEQLGANLTDDELLEFFDPEVETAELDQAYENAQYRGRPAILGLGVRPQTEADLLKTLGLDVNQAYANYEQIAGQLNRVKRVKAINNAASAQYQGLTGNDLLNNESFETLFAGIMQKDPAALLQIQQALARDAARWTAGGGAALQGPRALGLLPEGQR